MNYKKGSDTKEVILRGSKEFFLENGFHAATYRKLGAYLEINPNLISYHFSSKKVLAETVLTDYFVAESRLLREHMEEAFSPMLKYAAQNRIHYKILASDEKLLRFYADVVSSDFLRDVFFSIPGIQDLHMDFFEYYGLEKKYPVAYYSAMETASECEIVKFFQPSLYEDDQFLDFVGSIYPVFLGVPEEEIEKAFRQAKDICERIDVKEFSFCRHVRGSNEPGINKCKKAAVFVQRKQRLFGFWFCCGRPKGR